MTTKHSFLGTEDEYGIRPIDRFHNHGALIGGVGGWAGGTILGGHLARKAGLGFGGQLAAMAGGAILGGGVGGAAGLGAERLARHIWGNPHGDADRRVLYQGGLGRGARELGKSVSSLRPDDVKQIVYAEREREKEKMSHIVYASMADELRDITREGGMAKLAYGEDGHGMLTSSVARGANLGPYAEKLTTNYAAHVADGSAGTHRSVGRLADELKGQGGWRGTAGKVLGAVDNRLGHLGTAATNHPYMPVAAVGHSFDLDQSRQHIRDARASAARHIADAALAPNEAAKGRSFTRGMAHLGEGAHAAQDIVPHNIRVQEHLERGRATPVGQDGMTWKRKAGLKAADNLHRVPGLGGFQPMARSGIAHELSGLSSLPGGGVSAELDHASKITGREHRHAAKHGRKVFVNAVQDLRNRGVPTADAVRKVQEVMGYTPTASSEAAGAVAHRAERLNERFNPHAASSTQPNAEYVQEHKQQRGVKKVRGAKPDASAAQTIQERLKPRVAPVPQSAGVPPAEASGGLRKGFSSLVGRVMRRGRG